MTANPAALDDLRLPPTKHSEPYWRALREHRLILQKCGGCDAVRHYPRLLCDRCYSTEYDWIEAAGTGTVHSWTVTHKAFLPAFADQVPAIFVTVDLKEGVRMNGQLRDGSAEDLRIGLPVSVEFLEVSEALTVPMFRLLEEVTGGPAV